MLSIFKDQQPACDPTKAEVLLQLGENMQEATVVRCAIGPDGIVAGEYNNNMSDTGVNGKRGDF